MEFRIESDGALVVVNPDDPTTGAATDFCSAATTKPGSQQSTAYQNSVTLAIADCLEENGYHVTRNGDSGLADGDGRTVATFRVTEAEQQSPDYQANLVACQRDAEQSVPSPSA